MSSQSTRSGLAGNLLLAIGSPIVFLLLSEAVIAVSGVDTEVARNDNAEIAVPAWLLTDEVWVADRRSKWRREGDEPIAAAEVEWLYHFEEARWIGYKMKPNVDVDAVNPFNVVEAARGITFRLRSNETGFRERPFAESTDDVFRIVTLGDSSTFGWGVDAEETYQRLLEDRLNASGGTRFEVLNLGIPGHNSRHGLGILRHYGLDLDPDLLIVAYGANDPRMVPTPTDLALATDDTRIAGVRYALLELGTYRLLRKFMLSTRDPLRPGTPEIETVTAVPLPDFEANLREFRDLAAELGAPTVLMSVCTGQRPYEDAIRNTADALDAPLLQVRHLFAEKIDALETGELYAEGVQRYRERYGELFNERRAYAVTSDGCHPHWVGHSLIADALTPIVRDVVASPSTSPPSN